MKSTFIYIETALLLSLAFACKTLSSPSQTKSDVSAADASTAAITYSGMSDDGASPSTPCTVSIQLGSDGQPTSLSMTGRFTGPFLQTIPHDSYPARAFEKLTWDSKVNAPAGFNVDSTTGVVTITASGPSIWLMEGPSAVTHKITLRPSLNAPTSVSYESDQVFGHNLNLTDKVSASCITLTLAATGKL